MKYASAQPFLASCVLLKRDGKIAFVLRSNTGWMDGRYGLPSGKVEKGESMSQAAIRETKEETGVIINPENLKPLLICHRKADDDTDSWIDAIFETETWEGEVFNAEPEHHSGIAWFAMDDLPKNIIPITKFVLEQIRDGKTYCEYAWEE